VVGADLDGSPLTDQGALSALADGKVTPFRQQILALLVEAATAVGLEPVEVLVAEELDGDGGAAALSAVGDGLEVIEKEAAGVGVREQLDLAELGLGAAGLGHPVAVFLAEFGKTGHGWRLLKGVKQRGRQAHDKRACGTSQCTTSPYHVGARGFEPPTS
jgi:hypothetical protein